MTINEIVHTLNYAKHEHDDRPIDSVEILNEHELVINWAISKNKRQPLRDVYSYHETNDFKTV